MLLSLSEVSTLPIVIIFSVVVCLIAYTFREDQEVVFIIIVYVECK